MYRLRAKSPLTSITRDSFSFKMAATQLGLSDNFNRVSAYRREDSLTAIRTKSRENNAIASGDTTFESGATKIPCNAFTRPLEGDARHREREERASLTDLKLGAGWGRAGRQTASKPFGVLEHSRTREAEYGRAARSVVGSLHRRRPRRSRSAGVVGRDALSSPALAQLLRRRRRECVAARCRSPRSRAATGVTLALSLSSPSPLRRLAAVHLVAIFRHGDSELLCDTVKRDGALSRGQLQCTRAVIRKRLFGAPRALDFEVTIS